MNPFDMITSGQLLEGIVASYTNVMGNLFWALVIFLGLLILYLKTHNFGLVGITSLLIAGTILTYMPAQVHNLAHFLLIMGIVTILYRTFKGR